MDTATERHIETKLDHIMTTVNAIDKRQGQIMTTLDTIVPLVKEHERALRGTNGNSGIVEAVRASQKDHDLLHGDGDNPGLIDVVRTYRSRSASATRFMWIILGAVAGGAISTIFALLITHIP